MGARFSKAVDRRKARAGSDPDRMTSSPQDSNNIQSHEQRPTSLPSTTTNSPTSMDISDTSPTPPTERPVPPLLRAHADVGENGLNELPREPEAAADMSLPPPPPLPAGAISPPAPLGQPDPPAAVLPPIKKLEPRCIICTEELAIDKPAGPAVRPCRLCHSDYCKSCVKGMFIKACKDTTRMPPKCCSILQLHVALPMLSPDEAKLYREKYEEWSTPKPMYCPIPTCSAFISNRSLPVVPPDTIKKGKARVDSVIGTPKEVQVSCPKCNHDACARCRQSAHPGTPCQLLDFGVDKETAAALKRWGYKQCPKCGNGVRRMMGCNHMQCLCGAQFCWWCLVPMDECGGNCYEPEEEENDDYDADEIEELERERATKASLEGADAAPLVPLVVAGTINGRAINLDIASNEYWDARHANFGSEPAEEPPDRAWQCEHRLETAKVDFEQRLKEEYQVSGMQCCRCWATVYPEIALPKKMGNAGRVRMVGGYHRPEESRAQGRDRASRRGPTPGRTHTPLGTGHRNSGLQGHLDRVLGNLMVGNASDPGNSPASPQVFVDEYGDVIMTDGDSYTAERSMSISGNNSGSTSLHPSVTANSASTTLSVSAPQKTNAFPTEFTFRSEITYPPFSFAYECGYCGILLCNLCKESIEKEAQDKLEVEAAAEEEERKERELAAGSAVTVNSAESSAADTQAATNGTQAQPTTSGQTTTPPLPTLSEPTPEQIENQRRASEPSLPVLSVEPTTTGPNS